MLLEAVKLPQKAAVLQCKGHQKDATELSSRNSLANTAAKRVASSSVPTMALMPQALCLLPTKDQWKMLKALQDSLHLGHNAIPSL